MASANAGAEVPMVQQNLVALEQQAVNNNSKNERGKALRQIIAAFIANIGTINTGLVFGFSAVAVPQLRGADSFLQVDESQISWIASIASMATPLGCILTGYLMDVVGRKKAIIVTQFPVIAGWLIIASASSVPMMYVGRMLTGLGSGMIGAPSRVYTSEVTQPHLRGMLGALASVGISYGVLFQYTIGSFCSWSTLAYLCAVYPLMAFVLMLIMPESPNFLVIKMKSAKATKSLAKLRGSTYNIEGEVHRLETFAEKQRANSNQESSSKDLMQALLSPATLKPFAILVLYFMMYQFSGVNTITFYAVEIISQTGTTMDKYSLTILLGIFRLVFTIIACISMRKVGRRPLTFISGIGCGASMLGLGGYMMYKWNLEQTDPASVAIATWFPVLCIFTFTVTCTMGFLVVPWVMIGELYPQKVRGLVGGMTTCMAHTFVFIVVKTYPFLKAALYMHGAFILYGCISFLGTVFFYMYLPETKGKTLQDIEDYFSGRIASLKPTKNNNIEANGTNNHREQVVVEKDKLLPS